MSDSDAQLCKIMLSEIRDMNKDIKKLNVKVAKLETKMTFRMGLLGVLGGSLPAGMTYFFSWLLKH